VDDPTPIDHGAADHPAHGADSQLERIRAQRTALKDRHAQALWQLMQEREDLQGVHALADLVSDSLRWSA
jgi:hypothetical protein